MNGRTMALVVGTVAAAVGGSAAVVAATRGEDEQPLNPRSAEPSPAPPAGR